MLRRSVVGSPPLLPCSTHHLAWPRAQFPLDKELNENDVQDLIRVATERLLMKDSPSLEMVKMQVGFDVARVQ